MLLVWTDQRRRQNSCDVNCTLPLNDRMKASVSVLGSSLLMAFICALPTMKPTSITHLTMVTNYTFFSVCEKFHKADLNFDEVVGHFSKVYGRYIVLISGFLSSGIVPYDGWVHQ